LGRPAAKCEEKKVVSQSFVQHYPDDVLPTLAHPELGRARNAAEKEAFMNSDTTTGAGRREWIGLAVILLRHVRTGSEP
jgi:hypothetical protein